MYTIHIDNREIGPGHPVYMIAEIGVNHNGSVELAKKMIIAAKKSGAEAVKFQTFKAHRVVSRSAPKAAYQLETTDPVESQFDMLAKLELEDRDWAEIVAFCKKQEISFFSTPYGFEDADLLESLGVGAYKIASGQAVEIDFLKHVGAKAKPVLLSTGMCDMAEAARAVEAIRSTGNEQLMVLQCTTNYPSQAADANLRAMVGMGAGLDVMYGYSDHTETLNTAIAAAALGANAVERHFTLDKTMDGPDHSCSSSPDEFADLVRCVREVEACLGSPRKQPSEAEKRNAEGMRRSLFAGRDIAKDELFDWTNMIFKRPGTGIAGLEASTIPGRKAATDIRRGTMLDLSMIGKNQ
ncbi:MAG: N-acetylneuraminate synthase family protein [Desulfovibrionaceae bacterium]|nr:N-acetylneuraminate synthase family protein [Desulfovibrionaceae bacterium]